MQISTSMLPVATRRAGAILSAVVLVLAVAATTVSAQYRGEEIVGKIERVDGGTVIVRRDGGAEVRINVTPQTEVSFQDSGDKRMFPNPSSRDLKAGMGVRFVFNDGNPGRIVVHYVPSSTGSEASASSSGQQVKARIQSVNRSGAEIRADVAGSARTYAVADAAEGRAVRRGQLVVLTLEDRNGAQVVTRIDPADAAGTVVRVDGRTVVIEVNGQEETYSVDNRDLLDNVRSGQRVRFEVEERSGGRRVVTALRRE
jgi:ribosome maturation factor RimP